MINGIILGLLAFSLFSWILFIVRWGFYLLWIPGIILRTIVSNLFKHPFITLVALAVGITVLLIARHYFPLNEYVELLSGTVSGSVFALLKKLTQHVIKERLDIK